MQHAHFTRWISQFISALAIVCLLLTSTVFDSQPKPVFAQAVNPNTSTGNQALENASVASSPPGAFGKVSPANAATGASLNLTLIWAAASDAARYEYCYDTTNDNACSGAWTNAGTGVHGYAMGLSKDTTYYWQARAITADGPPYADGSATTWWSFTTKGSPAAFGKVSPANAATGVSLNKTLTWAAASDAITYEYCYDTTNDNACSGSWISAGNGRPRLRHGP